MSSKRANLVYLKDMDLYKEEKPYVVLSFLNNRDVTTNLAWEVADEEEIHDLRGREDVATLDGNGFCFRKIPTRFDAWDSRQRVEEEYLPEIAELLKREVPGIDEVGIFDWRRRGPSQDAGAFTNMNNPNDALNPAREVHLDQSRIAIVKRVRMMEGDRAEFLLQGRIRIINVWRPLYVVESAPLALCDGTSIGYDDLVEVDLIRKNYIGSTMYAKFRKGYNWYYLDRQTPEEVCLFKNFDSDDTTSAQICPHVSFDLGAASKGASPRESIEVRAIVYTYAAA